jgi:hypothetical protein
MKSYTHYFKGFGIHPSAIAVWINRGEDGKTWIGFEDLNEGTSVTNASEQLATEIVKKEGLVPVNCRFFDWYPQHGGDVDEVTYSWKPGNIASNPDWKPFCKASKNPFDF